MKPTYIEQFVFNTFFDLDEHREYMVRKVQLSKAGSSKYYPVFVPRSSGSAIPAEPTSEAE